MSHPPRWYTSGKLKLNYFFDYAKRFYLKNIIEKFQYNFWQICYKDTIISYSYLKSVIFNDSCGIKYKNALKS